MLERGMAVVAKSDRVAFPGSLIHIRVSHTSTDHGFPSNMGHKNCGPVRMEKIIAKRKLAQMDPLLFLSILLTWSFDLRKDHHKGQGHISV